jgi:transcriptional regulator with XRE-family HTH domain
MGIGYRIQKCRENIGLKQEELAEQVELSCNYLSAIEREVKTPKLDTLIRIINALGVSADIILIDVIDAGVAVECTQLEKKLKKLQLKDRKKALNILDVVIKELEK